MTPLEAIAFVLGGIGVMFAFSPWLGLLCLLTAVPVALLFIWFTSRIRQQSRLARTSNSNLTSNIQEAFSAIKLVKAMDAERKVISRFTSDSSIALDAAFHLRIEIALLGTGVAILTTTALLIAEYLMADWAISEKATFLLGMVTIVGFATWNLGQSSMPRAQLERPQGSPETWRNYGGSRKILLSASIGRSSCWT